MAIKTIGVIGAGTMGNGIAQAIAAKYYDSLYGQAGVLHV